MSTYTLLRFLHILSAIWFIAGILGRQLVMAAASKQSDLRLVAGLSQAAARFEQWMVMPGNLLVILFGVLVSLEGNWSIFGFLEGDGARNWLLASNVLLVANLILVPTLYIPRGKAFEQKLKAAIASGGDVGAVRAEMNDSLVRVAHYFEYASILAILYLMTFKPF